MKGNKIKIKTNMVQMPVSVYILTLVAAFLFGDAEAIHRINKDKFKDLIKKLKGEEIEDESESGDDEE